MMTRMAIWAALLALAATRATGQAAPLPFEGYWTDDPRNCALAGQIDDFAPERITSTDLSGLEYFCEFTAVLPIGVGQSWRIDMLCQEPGFSEPFQEIFVLDSAGRLNRIQPDGQIMTLIRCAARP